MSPVRIWVSPFRKVNRSGSEEDGAFRRPLQPRRYRQIAAGATIAAFAINVLTI